MRSVLLTLISLFLSLSLLGCSSSTSKSGSRTDSVQPTTKDTAPGMEGYVVDQRDGGILVVDNVPKNYGATGGVEEFYNAIWFSYAQKDVSIGQKVQVWFNEVLESYPGQSTAEKLRILSTPKPTEANMNEAEAIRRALEEPRTDLPGVPVIKAASYDETSDQWRITIKLGDDEWVVQIDDK